MSKSISRIFTLAKRNVKEILRDKISLAFLLGLPLFMEILFYYIFHGLTAQFDMKYLAPGIVVFSQAFLTLFAGLLIAVDRNSAFLTRLYVSKARAHEFIFGYAFALVPIAFMQSVLFFLVGGIIDPSVFGAGMIYGILLSLLPSALFIGLGILFGSVCSEKSVGGVSSIVVMGQSVLSGMWFPPEGLSSGIQTVMKCLPFKNASDLLQNALNGKAISFNDFWLPLIIIAVYTAATFIVAIIAFRKKSA